jgi:hypothetical protein
MRFLVLALLALANPLLAAPSEPVALKDGISPTKQHEVVLEADKDTPSFERYELKGDDSQFPRFLIRELPGGKTVGSLKWPGDTSGDSPPLRNHTQILWHPNGTAVAITTSERYYSQTNILALDPKTGKFLELRFPDYKTLTGYPKPKSDDLRPRGFGTALRWTEKGFLLYEMSSMPGASYKGTDPLHHRITLRVTPQGMEVVDREALPTTE